MLYDGSQCFKELADMTARGLLKDTRIVCDTFREGREIMGKLPDVMVGKVWETEVKLTIDRTQASFRPNKRFENIC